MGIRTYFLTNTPSDTVKHHSCPDFKRHFCAEYQGYLQYWKLQLCSVELLCRRIPCDSTAPSWELWIGFGPASSLVHYRMGSFPYMNQRLNSSQLTLLLTQFLSKSDFFYSTWNTEWIILNYSVLIPSFGMMYFAHCCHMFWSSHSLGNWA